MPITKRRRGGTATSARPAAKNEMIYDSLLENIDEGFCIIEVMFDRQGNAYDYRFLEANPAYEKQSGISDATGKTARELLPNLNQFWFDAYAEVVRTGEPARLKNAAVADNYFHVFDVYAFRVGQPDEHKVAVLFKDITEQRIAEESQNRLAAIVESSDDGIISKNLDGIVMSWNKGAEKIFGYRSDEMVGKSIRTIIPAELQKEEDEILSNLKQGKKIDHFQTVRIGKNGRRVEVSITVSPIKDRDGVIIGASKIARDVTQERFLQRQKDEFLGIASHELKTPVTSIKAYCQVLQKMFRKRQDTTAADALKKMDTQINKLTNLIGDLLDVTKIQSGKLQFHESDFDFNDLVNEITEELQLTTEKHRLNLDLAATKVIHGDRDRVGQVLANLITNAIKYSPGSDIIDITSSTSKEDIRICVRDFGVGIPKDKQGRIFEQFFRVSGPNHSTVPGLGLGLYISSEIVKRQGGRIWVESEEGKGSTFCFSLPLPKN